MSQRLFRICLIWLLTLLTFWVAEPYVAAFWLAARSPRTVTPRGNLSALEQSTIAAYKLASPSVVHVYATGEPDLVSGGAVLQTGSGVVWDAAGDVVTNNHVISGQNEFGVRVPSGELIRARLIGTAPNFDLAVLRLQRSRFPLRPIVIGGSRDLQVGQTVLAIGNPYGLDQTLTTGIISALHRRLPESQSVEIADVIQTDAPINPGNSGGALIDSAGRMIGLNTAILSESGASAGIGFAIPVDTVDRVAAALIRNGALPVPGIGITTASPGLSAELGVNGLIVQRVIPGWPGARAGLEGVNAHTGTIGDIVVAVNGQPVQTAADLSALLAEIGIGHTAQLTVIHRGQTRTVPVPVVDISAGVGPG